jgi:sugar O-acyltransferase (sialic acid O-acetyltransferase NeuD family)
VKVVIIGAGGHARSVLWALRSTGEHEVVALTDPDGERHGTEVDGVVIAGDDDRLAGLRGDGVEGAVLGVGGVGDNGPRGRLFKVVSELGFALPCIVHARAAVADRSALGRGTVVLAGAVVGPGAVVGEDVIVNTGALLEHDTIVGDHAHVASGAALAGGARISQGVHIGLGAVVLQRVHVGANAVVGAGAVVLGDVAPGAVVVGVPARAVKARRL